jgi:serine phosphatase RsbU (regulator of sigma subunit)/anti-sigma regulatory factor (Ser/Thr protein kinase)
VVEVPGELDAATRETAEHPVLDGVLHDLLDQVADLAEVDTAVLVLTGGAGHTIASGPHGEMDDQIAATLRLPIQLSRLDGSGQQTSDVTAAAGLDALLRADGIESTLAVPLSIDERFVGLLLVGSRTARSFSEREARVLQVLADRAALEVETGGLLERHRRGWTLQHSMLAHPLTNVPGIALASRYIPASSNAGSGGGWCDALVVGEGLVGLAVGDVALRGERAAVLAIELRNALRAYAIEDSSPAAVTRRMWHFLAALESGQMATFLYAVYDPVHALIRVASAGHGPPMLVGRDGAVRFPEIDPTAPLGVGGPPTARERDFRLEPGTTMVHYTDALAERPGERLAERRDRVARAAAGADGNEPSALCTHLIGTLLNGRRAPDDVALLAVQATAVLDDALHRVMPAVPEELPPLRRLLRRWLEGLGADDREIASITLAVQEAGANAVEHAYGMDDASFEVDAIHHGPAVDITITDHGRWRAPRGEDRGRGLDLMRALVDDVEVVRHEAGTVVHLRRTIGNGPAAL